MAREIKRVPVGFDWPLHKTWDGFINPYQLQTCGDCGGTGYNPATQRISDQMYKFDDFGWGWFDRRRCVEARAMRLGVYGICSICGGMGQVWDSPETETAHEAWTPTDPPIGDGYQVWETVGKWWPISPVFATPEELARWLVVPGNDTSVTRGTTYDQWLAFIRGPGWAPTFISGPGIGFVPGVAAVEGE